MPPYSHVLDLNVAHVEHIFAHALSDGGSIISASRSCAITTFKPIKVALVIVCNIAQTSSAVRRKEHEKVRMTETERTRSLGIIHKPSTRLLRLQTSTIPSFLALYERFIVDYQRAANSNINQRVSKACWYLFYPHHRYRAVVFSCSRLPSRNTVIDNKAGRQEENVEASPRWPRADGDVSLPSSCRRRSCLLSRLRGYLRQVQDWLLALAMP